MPQASINFVAVLVAALINMVIVGLWFSRYFYGRKWRALLGKKEPESSRGFHKDYFYVMVASLLAAYIMAHIVSYTGATTLADGAKTGFWVWLGFVATFTLVDYMLAGRRKKLYLITAGYSLASLIAMGALLAVWV